MKSPIVVGPRCCGKTTRNKMLAEALEISFVDADDVFEANYGSIKNLINTEMKKYGPQFHEKEKLRSSWMTFRLNETAILEAICTVYRGQLISLAPGGGAVAHDQGDQYRARNVELLRKFGTIFYVLPTEDLEASAMILTERERADDKSAEQRPPLNMEANDYQRMLKTVTERHPLYQEAAHHTIYTDGKTIEDSLLEICDILKSE